MEKHKEKFHKIVSALSNSPLATSVRTLFLGDNADDITLPSTQGGSDGSVNSPKVITEGTFQCNECPKEYSRKDDLKNHMTMNHNKAQAAPTNDKEKSATPSESISEDEDDEEEMREIAKAIELGNMITVDKIVDSFVDTAFHEMNPSIPPPDSVCDECTLKDKVFNNREEMINEKDCLIVERNATIKGLMETIKNMTKERTDILKKAKETEKNKENYK